MHRFYRKADKSVVEVKLSTPVGTKVRGEAEITRLEIFNSKYIAAINNKIGLIEIGKKDGLDSYKIQQWANELTALIDEADRQEINLNIGADQKTWVLDTDKSTHTLRENYKDNEAIVQAHFRNMEGSPLGQTLKLYYSGPGNIIKPEHYYDFDVYDVVDPYVYGVVDAASLVPIPWVSGIADGLGLLYSTYRGDVLNQVLYTTGITLVVGAGIIKFVDFVFDDLFVIAARHNTDDALQLVVRRIGDLPADEIAVTTARSSENATLLRTEFEKSTTIKENISTFVRQANGVGLLDNLLAKIKNFENLKPWVQGLDEAKDALLIAKIDNLGQSGWLKLDNYLNGASNEFKSLLKQPGRLDAWKLIDEAIDNLGGITHFATDPATVNKVADMMASGSSFRVKFPDNLESKLKEAFDRNRHLNCKTCGGNFNRGPNMDEFLDDFQHINLHFSETSDVGKRLHQWTKRKYLNGNDIPIGDGHLSESHQFLNFVRKKDIKEVDIKNIDGAFFDDVATSKKYDIELESGNTLFFELKNKDFLSKSSLDAHDIAQVIGANGALSKITSIEQYNWVAYLRRFGDNATILESEAYLKTLWKKAFEPLLLDICRMMATEAGATL